ncbi:hypothetical protein [Sulfolobus acidocaldarius]|uniref:Cell division control protein 45 homolog n=4 Tax=Sulfolobus acidocaldarius TaxID=2285 RepID=CDC45_SULAC|nr:hypothetical protein [Sulfolobus acidocaldarius]AAY79596.1 conserved protein [Sulfolobus acidocaldarius DSM 639]AGE70150.1 single-stranded-DNA-specific exonuclease [Sulfolobus acidocaldarius N8]AGE72425.1 single-stranded-DNA-specific exonuclease [Sulfolobus acidocaldarius Ron12/I]ALU29437.1 single-stranded DNA exonuclease [Sulfolobus acidocaldarius]ALU32166.1 single-stranded DNA exonuclease [Sulfolobus acidocaldarius]
MESFLNEPSKEELRNLVSEIISYPKPLCVKSSYTIDSLIASFLLGKYAHSSFMLTFNSECPVKLEQNSNGDRLIKFKDKTYFLGSTSFSSIFPLSSEDLLPMIIGIVSSLIVERRELTNVEKSVIEDMKNLGVSVEKNLKIPNYKNLPLFFSLTISFDPYIPGMSGNREGTIKALKEIGINETERLEEINETKLNTLLYKITNSVIKVNPKFSRNDLITDRILYMDYDSLELAFSAMYFLDLKGVGELFQVVMTPSYSETLITRFRDEMARGYRVDSIVDFSRYYLISTDLKSPLLAYIIYSQQGKVKRDKPVVLKNGEIMYTSRYFMPYSSKEGLIKVENKDFS